MSKISLLVAGGVGYVLGARAGRERYDQIADLALKVRGNPTVQQAADRATDVAATQAAAAAEAAKQKASEAASAVRDKVGDDDGTTPPSAS